MNGRLFLGIFTGLLLLLASCDKITDPVEEKKNTIDTELYPGEGLYVIPPFGEYPSDTRNVLIEDFTGHRCGNCPLAATIAHGLKEEYPGRVFVVAIHSALPPYTFQKVSVPGDGEYPKYSHNFRTIDGDRYPLDIDGFIGNPVGMINRITDQASQIWQFHPNWSSKVNEILDSNDPLLMNVQVNTNYYTETRGLFVHVQSETLVQSLQGQYHMVIYLTANDIVDWQKDYTADPQDIEFYHHRDVLLYNINGAYGDMLFNSESVRGEHFRNHYTYAIPDSIDVQGVEPGDDTGLSVIVYLMNRDTYEIIQVVEKGITISQVN